MKTPILILLLCCLAGALPLGASRSIETVLASDATVTSRVVWDAGITAGQLGIQQDKTGIALTAGALRVGTGYWRIGIGGMRWIQVLDGVSIPGLSDLRRLPRQATDLPDADTSSGCELDRQVFAAAQVSAGGAVIGAAARLVLQPGSIEGRLDAEEQQLQLRLLSEDRRIGAAGSLLVRETVLPALSDRPYRLEYPVPGPGLGREWRSIVWGRWQGGTSAAGLFVGQLPHLRLQPGGFLHHRWRSGGLDLELRAAAMPDRLSLRGQQFRQGETGLLAAGGYASGAVRSRLLAEAVSREGQSRLSATASSAVGESGVHLRTASEVKASGELRLETGARWEYRAPLDGDGWEPELLRIGLQAGFLSPAQRSDQRLEITVGQGPLRAEYSAARNSDIPGVEQQAALTLRTRGYALHAEIAWNSLVRGAAGEIGVYSRR